MPIRMTRSNVDRAMQGSATYDHATEAEREKFAKQFEYRWFGNDAIRDAWVWYRQGLIDATIFAFHSNKTSEERNRHE